MKIVCFHLLNDYSGSPKVLRTLVEGLLESGCEVDLITSSSCPGALDGLPSSPAMKRYRVRYRFRADRPAATVVRYVLSQLRLFFFSFRYVSDRDAVFYVNTVLPAGAALAGRLTGHKVVYHYHENAHIKGHSYRVLAWLMEHLADEIICVSRYQASFLRRKDGVRVIPNGLTEEFLSSLSPDPDRAFASRNVLMLSSLKDYKGVMEFIRMAGDMPDYSFTLVINDTEEAVAAYLEDRGAAVLPGNLAIFPRQSDVSHFYNEAGMVVNLTDRNKAVETFGMTTLEAFGAGLPVIVPTVGGPAELVDGNNGFKIDVQDMAMVETTIAGIFGDRERYMSMAAAARNTSGSFGAGAMVKQVRHVLAGSWVDSLFLEILRYSIGTQESLQRVPEGKEWALIYRMSQIQSIAGVVFDGVQKLAASVRLGGLPPSLYYTWLPHAVELQELSERHRDALLKVNAELRRNGIRAIFMKGIMCASRYPNPLSRQCGDVDFVVPEEEFSKALDVLGNIADVDRGMVHEHHGMASMGDVLLEPHYKIHNFQNPRNDRRMRRFQKEIFSGNLDTMDLEGSDVSVFPFEFEGMFLISHMVNHVYEEGLGLRQVVDFAQWLRAVPGREGFDAGLYHSYLKRMRMVKAARLFTLICEKYLGVDVSVMGYSYSGRDQRQAGKLVDDIMEVGNFACAAGQAHRTGVGSYMWVAGRAVRLGFLCPAEAACWPFGKFFRFVWKKLKGGSVPVAFRRTRVAVVGIQGLPAKYGGFETLVSNLVKEKSSPSVQYTVFCSSKDMGAAKGRKKFAGAELRHVGLFRANGAQSIPYDIVSLLKCLGRGYDVVLVLGVSGCVFLPVFRLLYKGRIIVNIDGLEHRRAKWGPAARWFLRLSEKCAVRAADVVVADNKGIQDYVSGTYRLPSALIAYGGDQALRDVPEEKARETLGDHGLERGGYALSICRIEPENNCHMILEAFASGAASGRIVFVGNWKHGGYGRDLYARYCDVPGITLLDPIYDLDVLHVLRSNAAAYVHGHSAGGTNPSLVEAMQFPVPVIAYDCVYNRETTHGRALYFSDKASLGRCLGDREAFAGVAAEMQRIAAEEYRWSVIARKYESLYEQ